MSIRDSQIDLLARLLDVACLRHNVIAQNVANVNTPGFKRQEVHFEDALAKALEGNKGLTELTPQVVTSANARERADGNSVDMDMEMGALAKNGVFYKAYTQVLAMNLAQWRSAIGGR